MKMPITKRTVLSLAVAASLACGFSSAFAEFECSGSGSSWTCTGTGETGENLYLYRSSSVDRTLPTTASDVSGDVSFILDGVTVLSDNESNGYVAAIYQNSSTGSLTTGDITVQLTNSTLYGPSDESLYEDHTYTVRLIGAYLAGTAETGSVKVDIDESTISNGNVYGVYLPSTSTGATVNDVTINLTNSSITSGSYTTTTTDNNGKETTETHYTGGNLYGMYESSTSGTTTADAISITLTGIEGSRNLYGYYFYTSSSSTASSSEVYIGTASTSTSTSPSPSVSLTVKDSALSEDIYGVMAFHPNGASVTAGDVEITLSNSLSNRIVGAEAYDFTGGNSTFTVGDVAITLVNGSSTGSYINGFYIGTDSPNNGSGTYKAGSISIDIDGSLLSTSENNVVGARIARITAEATFTIGNIAVNVTGSKTESDIYGFRVGNTVSGKVTGTIGDISIAVSGGSETGSFHGYHENSGSGGNTEITIDSIAVSVSSLELEEGSSADEIAGIHKDGSSSLTINDTVTVDGTATNDAVAVIVENSAGSTVRGIYSTGGSVSTNDDVSITVTDAIDSDVHGVYATGGTISIGGDVTLSITGSAVGTESTESNIYGVYNGTSALSVGNISITLNKDDTHDSTDSASITGLAEVGATGTGEAATKAGNISITVTDTQESGDIYGYYKYNSATETAIGNIEIVMSDDSGGSSSDSGNIYGAYLETAAGSLYVKDIDVTVDGVADVGGRIYGYWTRTDSNVTAVIDGSVTVMVLNSTGATNEYTRGVNKGDTGTLTINGDVTVAAVNVLEGRVQGLIAAGGTTTMTGNITVYLQDVDGAQASYDNVTGLWVEGDDAESPTVVTINSDVNSGVGGNVDVIYVADDQNTPATFQQNIFGVGIGGYGAMANYSTVTVSGDVTVSLAGEARYLGMGTHSIYGVLVGLDQDSTYEGKNTYSGGSRILSFGYSYEDESGSVVQNPFTSASDTYLAFDASFSNFDEIIVTEGSTLYLTSEQNAHLIGDQDFFGFGPDNNTNYAGSKDGTYGPVEGFANIDGIVGRGGVLAMPESTKLTLEKNTTADILVVENEGTISIGEGATLTTYSDAVEVETSTASNPKDSYSSDYLKDESYSGFNTGTIQGVDGVDGTGTFIVDAVGELGSSAFENKETGTITIHTLSVFGSLTNDGKIDAKTTTVGNTDGVGLLTNIAIGTVTTDSLTVVSSYSPAAVDNAGTLTILAESGNSSIAGVVSNTATGKFNIGSDSGTWTVTVASGGSIDNAGTLIESVATPLYVSGGTITNTGTFTANGTTVVEDGGIITNATNGYMTFANLTITKGTVGGATSISGSGGDGDISSYYTVVEADGSILTSGSFTVVDTGDITDGYLSNAGTIDIGYTVDESSGEPVYTINENATATLVGVVENSGTITVGHLDTIQTDPSLDPLQYTQTAGSFSVVGNTSAGNTENSDWFKDSLVTVTGGKLDSYDLGTGNTYVLGTSGSIDQKPVETAKYTIYTLTQDSKVSIYSGSVLQVESIDTLASSTAGETTVLAGGTLSTYLEELFKDLSYETIDLNAEGVDSDLVTDTHHSIVTGFGGIDSDANAGIKFESGVVSLKLRDVTEEFFSVAVTGSILEALRNAEGTYNANIYLVFDGHVDEQLTVGLANQVIAQYVPTSTKTGTPAATYALDSLYNQYIVFDENQKEVIYTGTALVVGEGTNDPTTSTTFYLTQSMGFKSVIGVEDGVTITDGYTLNLVGEKSSATDSVYTSFVLASGNSGENATISIQGSDASLILGNYGIDEKTGGTVYAVEVGSTKESLGGNLIVRNGDFSITNLSNAGSVTVESNGQTKLSDNASLTVGTYTADSGSSLLNNAAFIAGTIVMAENATSTTITNNNTMTVNGDATVVGTVVNGTVDGSTEYAGTLTVSGAASIDGVLTNAAGSTATFAALSLSDSSLSGEESDNAGTMTATVLTVAASASLTNEKDATLTLTDSSTASSIAGTISNSGSVGTQDIEISGRASNNTGAAWTTEGTLTVSGEGNVANASEMSADALVMEAAETSFGNTGNLTVANGGSIAGTFENANKATVTGTLTLAKDGSIINSGTSSRTAVMTIDILETEDGSVVLNDEDGSLVLNKASKIAGILTNTSNIATNDIEISGTGQNNDANAAWTTDGTLTVSGEGSLTNIGDMSATSLKVTDSAKVVTSNNLTVSDAFTISGGSLSVSGGTFTTSASTLSGGMVCVGFDCSGISTSSIKPLAADSDPVTVELSASGDMGSQIYVANNSKLNLGKTGGIEWAENVLTSLKLSYSGDLLVMRSSTNIVDSGTNPGTISVGSQTENGGLYFAGDSTLVIDYNSIGDSIYSSTEETPAPSAVFVYDGASNVKATVDDGATLVLAGDLTKDGRYDITKGYTSDLQGWKDSFTWGTEDGTVYGIDSSGIGWELEVKTEPDNGDIYIIAVSHEDVRKEYPDVNIPNIADDDLNDCKDGDYVCGILRDPDLDKDQKTDIINSSSTLLFDGGVTAVSRDGAGTSMDYLYNHLTMDSDTFDKDAKLWQYEESENIWIDVMGNWSKAKSLFTATGLSHFGYRNHSYGFITGWDHKFEDRPFVLGVALSFDKGNLKSRGSVSQTKNLYKDYGVHIFGNYSENEHLNLIGSLHWLHNNSGVTQSTGVSEFSKVSGSMHTNTFAAGLRAETMIKAGDINVIPHVEARYMYGKTRAFDTKVSGTKVWRTKADGTHTLQIPFGVAFRTDKKFDNGWNVRPNLDLQAIPQIGNTKQKTVVTNFNGVSDVIVGQFAGKWAGQAKIGVQADKKNATIGANYSFLGGSKGRAGHTFMLQARTRF